MTDGNGKSAGGMMAPPTDTVPFTIGGQKFDVPVLTLFVLDKQKDNILGLGPEIDFIERAKRILQIVVFSLRETTKMEDVPDEETLLRNCSFKESQDLIVSFNELLSTSGFTMPSPEVDPATAGSSEASPQAASPGTGTSTSSPQN